MGYNLRWDKVEDFKVVAKFSIACVHGRSGKLKPFKDKLSVYTKSYGSAMNYELPHLQTTKICARRTRPPSVMHRFNCIDFYVITKGESAEVIC